MADDERWHLAAGQDAGPFQVVERGSEEQRQAMSKAAASIREELDRQLAEGPDLGGIMVEALRQLREHCAKAIGIAPDDIEIISLGLPPPRPPQWMLRRRDRGLGPRSTEIGRWEYGFLDPEHPTVFSVRQVGR